MTQTADTAPARALVAAPFTQEILEPIEAAILGALGYPLTDYENIAANALTVGEYGTIDLIAAMHPTSDYCRCLSYLGSAKKLTPGTAKILSEAMRAAADHVGHQTLVRLTGLPDPWLHNPWEAQRAQPEAQVARRQALEKMADALRSAAASLLS